MGKSVGPYANRGPKEYTSLSSAAAFSPPIVWVHVVSAGSGGLVVKTEDGTANTYTGLVAGDVLVGPFSELTSMTLSKIRVGDGRPPTSTVPSSSGLNGATVPAGSALTTGNVLQVTGAAALAYAPVNLGGGPNYVTGFAPGWATAATQTTSFTAAVDTFYYYSVTSAVTLGLPPLASTTDGHAVHFFNNATSAGVITPSGSDLLAASGGAGATAATAAGPTGGNMVTYVSANALGKWIKWQ